MRKWLKALAGLALAALPSLAFGQATILQGGTWTPGHAPMYVGSGSTIPVAQDSGPAGGGGVGLGLSELLLVARGTGTPPFVGQGSGPLGTNFCDYDAPITNPTGFHYFCLSANAQGGGLLAYGFGGGASPLPLSFNVNGTSYAFPFNVGGIIGPGTTVVNDLVVWNNTSGTLVKDVPFVTVCASNVFSSTLAGCVPASGGGTTNFLRADGTWAPTSGGSVSSVIIGAGTGIAVSGTCTITTSGTCTVAMASIAASSLLGNATTGGAAPAAFTIGALPAKGTPASNDLLLLQDQAAAGALKSVTVSAVAGTSAIPPGTILDFAGTTPPAGFLLADGSCVSQVTFAGLFAVLSTSWGSCGAGLFALPDLRGRFTAGVDGGVGRITNAVSGCNATLATGCGAQSRTISAANVPQLGVAINDPGHIHSITDPGHVHALAIPTHSTSIEGSAGSLVMQGVVSSDGPFTGNTDPAVTGITVNAGVTSITATANTGSPNTATPVLNPVLIVNKIIKF